MSKKPSFDSKKSSLKSDVDTSVVVFEEIDFAETTGRLIQNELTLSASKLDKKPNRKSVDTEDLKEPWYFAHV